MNSTIASLSKYVDRYILYATGSYCMMFLGLGYQG